MKAGQKPDQVPPCRVCTKPTRRECSHIDCPNRRPQTAGYESRSAEGSFFGCYHTQPTNKE